MANLKEFNFQHQTVAPLESHHQRPPRVGASAALAGRKRRKSRLGVAGMRRGSQLKTFKQNSLATCRLTLVRLRPRGGGMASK